MIAGDNYGEAGAIEFYAAATDFPTSICGCGSYWYFGPGDIPGTVLIVIGTDSAELATFYGDVRLRGAHPQSLVGAGGARRSHLGGASAAHDAAGALAAIGGAELAQSRVAFAARNLCAPARHSGNLREYHAANPRETGGPMTPHASRGWWLAVAAISSAAVGCSSDTRPTAPLSTNTSAALAVANTFQHMGDSVVAAQGDSDDAGRFYGAAAVLRRVPVYDTITVLVDSVPVTFNAVALAVDDTGSTACPMPPMDDGHDQGYECPWGAPRATHTLFAWQPGHPPHIIQLVASSDSGAIGLPR